MREEENKKRRKEKKKRGCRLKPAAKQSPETGEKFFRKMEDLTNEENNFKISPGSSAFGSSGYRSGTDGSGWRLL
jgi:hypothetical protein